MRTAGTVAPRLCEHTINSVSSPAIVPMASSQSCPSGAAATGCALPTVVLITNKFCAAFTSSTNSLTSRETGGKAGSDTASPGITYPAPVFTRPSS